MIDFLLHIDNEAKVNQLEIKTVGGALQSAGNSGHNLFISQNSLQFLLNFNDEKLIFIGDVIVPYYYKHYKETWLKEKLKDFTPEKLKNLNGFFYLIHINHKYNTIDVYSSVFSILPVYYTAADSGYLISSKINIICEYVDKSFRINRRFLLQQWLFNYSLFDDTIYKDVKLLPSNCYMHYSSSGFKVKRHTDIRNYFTGNPESWKKSAEKLAHQFIKNTKDYFPEEPFFISFTSGFDGRTLVASAIHHQKDFSSYSFGTSRNEDLVLPLKQAKELNLPFTPIYLDEAYYINSAFLNTGKELLHATDCNSNLLYGHFLQSAKRLSRYTNYTLTGFFGSELMRALHLTGAFNSAELVSFFMARNEDEWIHKIRNSYKLNYLNKDIYQEGLEDTIEELKTFKKNTWSDGITLNQFYYTYVFEEIFRKFFGPLIHAQMNYIKIRAPYLNFDFIEQLLKTGLAGANNDFFTQNPLKRFKGQYLYAKIIQKTAPELLNYQTGKGYAPKDILSNAGKLRLLLHFIKKKSSRKMQSPNLDNLSIISGLNYHSNYYLDLIRTNKSYDHEAIAQILQKLDSVSEEERDLFAIAASQVEYQNRTPCTK